MDSLLIQFWITGLSCVPRSVQWNASSRMIVGFSCLPDLQYQRRRSDSPCHKQTEWNVGGGGARRPTERGLPIEPSGRTRSTTIPMVFANRTGLCGVLAMKRN